MIHFRKWIGLWRSIAIYYWKPFNRRRLKAFYSQFIKEGQLCFDIGAHVGNRADAWLLLGARVIAVEPQPCFAAYLRKRFRKKNGFTLVEKAVGEKPEQAVMHISHLRPTVSTLAGENWRQIINEDILFKVKWEEQQSVEVITLDQLIANYGLPQFCKLDIENFELEALKGLSHPIPSLSFEYCPATPDRTAACIDRLASIHPYEFNWSFGESQKLQSNRWMKDWEMKQKLEKINRRYPYGDIYARMGTIQIR